MPGPWFPAASKAGGMALGVPDADAVANRLSTERVPVEGFARLSGF
jgi:hypothetical protein